MQKTSQNQNSSYTKQEQQLIQQQQNDTFENQPQIITSSNFPIPTYSKSNKIYSGIQHTKIKIQKLSSQCFNPNYNWNQYFDQLQFMEDGTSIFKAGKDGIIFVCIHGAGHSAMSYALLAQQIKKFAILIAYDLKNHGHSKKIGQDMSLQTLMFQNYRVIEHILNKYVDNNIVMVGHSLGGVLCCRLVEQFYQKKQNWDRFQGMIVIDVVQGAAIQSLQHMSNLLKKRVQYFTTIQSAIKWSIQSKTLRKIESAQISIPPQLKQCYLSQDYNKLYQWKIDLLKTQKYWEGWFKGLSASFLKSPIPKILLVANRNCLDNELIFGQMKGKFKLCVLDNVGHSIHQDDYKGTAKIFYEMLEQFKIPLNKNQFNLRGQIGISQFAPKLNVYK